MLVDAIRERIGQFDKALLRLLFYQVGFDLSFHFIKAAGLGRLDFGQLDDVKTEIAFHDVADVALLH